MCGWQARLAPAEEESSACRFIYFRTAWHFKRGYSLQSHHSRVLRGPSLCYQNNPAVPHTPSTIVVSGPKWIIKHRGLFSIPRIHSGCHTLNRFSSLFFLAKIDQLPHPMAPVNLFLLVLQLIFLPSSLLLSPQARTESSTLPFVSKGLWDLVSV